MILKSPKKHQKVVITFPWSVQSRTRYILDFPEEPTNRICQFRFKLNILNILQGTLVIVLPLFYFFVPGSSAFVKKSI